MAFQQKFKKTRVVKNIDSSTASAAKTSIGLQQEYEEADEVVNIRVGEKDEKVRLLCDLIEKMSESQIDEFSGKLMSKALTEEELSEDYSSLLKRIKEKRNVKQGIIEYVKSGCAVISLVNALLSLAKIVIGN